MRLQDGQQSGDSRDYTQFPKTLRNPWAVLRGVRMRHLVRSHKPPPKPEDRQKILAKRLGRHYLGLRGCLVQAQGSTSVINSNEASKG